MDETDTSPSWTLSVLGDERPFELVVRDALRLDTAAETTSPPPLAPYPDDHSGLLTDTERTRVAEQWTGWWRDRVAGEMSGSTAPAARPELERACTLLEPLVRRWSRREPARDLDATALTSLDCGAVAVDVAARHGVGLGRVRGTVLAFGVAGPWRRIVAPGLLLCSVIDLETEPGAVVREVFESAVDDPGSGASPRL